MAYAPSHGLLAELCTLMQRSNEGQLAMHKSIEALAECWRMSASASTSRSDPDVETRLQRLEEERARPAWGASCSRAAAEMANAQPHGLLAELCTLMQRSNEGQRAVGKSIEELVETHLQRLEEERRASSGRGASGDAPPGLERPAWGASDAYLHLGKQILEQGREQNRVLNQIHEKATHAVAWGGAPTGREDTDAKRSLQFWARGEGALLSRHVQEKLVQMVYEHGDCEAVEHASPQAAQDKRRIELATVVFWKGSQGPEPFLFDVFSSRGGNMRGVLELMPSVRKMFLAASAHADIQLGEEAASRLPFGKQRARIEDALGGVPEGLQTLHEVVLPVDRHWRPVLQVRDAEAEAYQRYPYDSLPESIKRFIELGQRAGLASRSCMRVAATEMIVQWCRHISELCYMQWALDDAKHREAEARRDFTEEHKRRQVDKRLIEGLLAQEYPRYRKISEDYEALQAQRAAERSETDEVTEEGAQGGDAPSGASS